MASRDITAIEEGIAQSDDPCRKSENDEASTFCTSANVVVLTQKV